MSGEQDRPLIDGYDHLPVETLRERVLALTAEQVRELIGYEQRHAERTDVLELLTDRLAWLEGGRT